MAKQQQSFKNHIRLVPGFHYFVYALILLLTIAGTLIIIKGGKLMPGLVVILISVLFGLVAFYARLFALKAQDRAIRAEESLRYYILTGSRLISNLRIGQIIALRFASDDEFVELVARAEKENLSSKEIKQAIKNWRGDYHRV